MHMFMCVCVCACMRDAHVFYGENIDVSVKPHASYFPAVVHKQGPRALGDVFSRCSPHSSAASGDVAHAVDDVSGVS